MPTHNYKEEIESIIIRALADGASDVHLTAGQFPTFRVSGNLVPLMNLRALAPEDTMGLLSELITPEFIERFLRDKEIDFSYDFYGKARFRGNAFYQKGSVGVALRAIPAEVKTMAVEPLEVFGPTWNRAEGAVLPMPTFPLSKTARPKLVEVEFWVMKVGAVVVPEPIRCNLETGAVKLVPIPILPEVAAMDKR